MIHNLSKTNSIFNVFLSEIRDAKIQKDAMRFRKNMERISEIMAYELSKTLEFKNVSITTPLGQAETAILKDQPVLATILRAGLAMHQCFFRFDIRGAIKVGRLFTVKVSQRIRSHMNVSTNIFYIFAEKEVLRIRMEIPNTTGEYFSGF